MAFALAGSLCACSGGTSASSSSSSTSSLSSSSAAETAKPENGAIAITFGTTYTEDYCEVTFKSAEWKDELVYNLNGGGIHNVAHAQEGKAYLEILCDIKNTNTDAIAPNYFMNSALFSAGKYNYAGEVTTTGLGFNIDPLDTKECVIFAAIPDELQNEPINLKVIFAKDPSIYVNQSGNQGTVYNLALSNE